MLTEAIAQSGMSSLAAKAHRKESFAAHVLCIIKRAAQSLTLSPGDRFMTRSARFTTLRPVGAFVVCALALGACSSNDKKSADSAGGAGAPTTTAADSMSNMGGMKMDSSNKMGGMKMDSTGKMGGMAMTGDPDRDFLRMMSDHHKGLVEMAHMTKEQKPASSAVADAAKLDTKQDAELDKMQTMLEKTFKDPYTPKVTADNQAMVDQLRGKTGPDYARIFYQNIVKHHQQAVAMVDEYLPKLKNATVKQMAEKMKADQTKEIAEFQKKAGAIK